MNRRVALRALSLMLGWGSVGLMLSAVSCKTQAELDAEAFQRQMMMQAWNASMQLRLAQEKMAAEQQQGAQPQQSPQEVIDAMKAGVVDTRNTRNKNECPAGCPKPVKESSSP